MSQNGGQKSNFDRNTCNTVMNISHILENILGRLETKDLLKCRLINNRIQTVSSYFLRTTLTLSFTDFALSDPTGKTQEEIKLSKLTKILKKRPKHSTIFPCSKYTFGNKCKPSKTCSDDISLGSKPFIRFLKLQGEYITDLNLNFGHFIEKHLISEEIVMNQIKRVMELTPNLVDLKLNINCKIKWKLDAEDLARRGHMSSLKSSDPEFQDIRNGAYPRKNFALKQITCEGETSSKILELVIQISPNLEEILLQLPQKHGFYFEPVNRIQFLKVFKFVPSPWSIHVMEKIATSLVQNSTNLKVFWMIFPMAFVLDVCAYYSGGYSKYPDRIQNVCNMILTHFCDTLEEVLWSGVGLLEGLVWPKRMINIWKISLGYGKPYLGRKCFPKYRIQTEFPRLKSLHFFDFDEVDLSFGNLASTISAESAFLVKNLSVAHKTNQFILPQLEEEIKKVFQNVVKTQQLAFEEFDQFSLK